MDLVKKSNFGVRGEGKKRIRNFRFGGNCSQAPRGSVGRFRHFPEPSPRKRNKSGHLRTSGLANAINPGIPGLENPQTQ